MAKVPRRSAKLQLVQAKALLRQWGAGEEAMLKTLGITQDVASNRSAEQRDEQCQRACLVTQIEERVAQILGNPMKIRLFMGGHLHHHLFGEEKPIDVIASGRLEDLRHAHERLQNPDAFASGD